MTEFYAQPYSLDHTGFYFDSIESYEAGMKRLNSQGCEEVEIQLIDADDHLGSREAVGRQVIGTVGIDGAAFGDLGRGAAVGRAERDHLHLAQARRG